MREELKAINQKSIDLMNKPESEKLGMLIWLLVGAIDIALGWQYYPIPDEHLPKVISHLKSIID